MVDSTLTSQALLLLILFLVSRQLAFNKKKVEGRKIKRDLVEDYFNYGSQVFISLSFYDVVSFWLKVYAPLTREGRTRDSMTLLNDIQLPTLSSLQALQSLDEQLITSRNENILSPKPKENAKTTVERQVLLH
jgi:hypothetical protein